MFRPQIQKSSTLIAMATVTMLTIFWVANSIEYIPSADINEKKEATQKMSDYIESLKTIPNNNVNEKDIYSSGLIGVEFSSTTSLSDNKENSFLNSKIACTHPNFSALIINLFNRNFYSATFFRKFTIHIINPIFFTRLNKRVFLV